MWHVGHPKGMGCKVRSGWRNSFGIPRNVYHWKDQFIEWCVLGQALTSSYGMMGTAHFVLLVRPIAFVGILTPRCAFRKQEQGRRKHLSGSGWSAKVLVALKRKQP